MLKKIINALKYLALLAAGILLLWLTFRNENPVEFLSKLGEAKPLGLILSVVLAIIALFSRAYRWNLMLEPLGFKPGIWNTFYAICIGYFANLALPRLGEITRCGVLNRTSKVPFNELIGTVVVERAIDVVMLAVSILLAASLEFDVLGKFLYQTLAEGIGAKLGLFLQSPLFLVSALLALAVCYFVARYFLKKFAHKPSVKKIKSLWRGLASGLKTIIHLKKKWEFAFHTVLIWVLYFFMSYFCFFALESTSHLGFKAGIFVLVLGGLGMSAPVQGGIGAYHFLVSKGLLLFGISETDGKVFATLVHTSQIILIVVLGLISLLLLTGKLSGKTSTLKNLPDAIKNSTH